MCLTRGDFVKTKLHRKFNKPKGMTLIEVLFATAIFSFVSITLFVLFKLGQTYWGRGISYNLIQNDMKKTTTLLEKYLKQADFDITIVSSTTPKRGAIFTVIQNEQGNYEYIGFVATSDMVPPDNTGYLYFIFFGSSTNLASFTVNNLANATRDNISQINLSNTSLTGTRKNILLSDNIGSFVIHKDDVAKSIRITLNFVKKTIGEGTTQAIGASLFITPLNKFQ